LGVRVERVGDGRGRTTSSFDDVVSSVTVPVIVYSVKDRDQIFTEPQGLPAALITV
jgi:hypothetical protein